MAFLELDQVSKHFQVNRGLFGGDTETIKAVDEVSLDVKRGEILGVVGESGCGKTTLSRMIMQIIPPTAGKIIFDGAVLSELTTEELRRRQLDFQMIFQDPYASLNPRMTVFSALAEAINTRHPMFEGEVLTQAVGDLMTRVGLNHSAMRKYPHEFSGGQRQRIAIARALAPEPKLILADEPVSALDVSIQSQILNLLRHLSRDLDLTLIFISHDLSVVRYIADRIAVMNRGKIVELGEANTVFETPQMDYTRTLLEAIPELAK